MICGCTDSRSPEHAYMPSHWAMGNRDPETVIREHVKKATEASRKAREQAPCRLSIPYGQRPRQKLDIYGETALSPDAPVVVYIHGGYWKALSKDESAYPVLPLLHKNIITIIVDYTLAPEAKMEEIVSEIGEAGKFILGWAAHRGSKAITVVGHSAGAHLAAMMLINDEVRAHPQRKLIKTAFLISGLYDLVPLLETSVNTPLRMTEETARHNSPKRLAELLKSWGTGVEFRVVLAENDPPAFFAEQSLPFHRKLLDLRLPTEMNIISGTDHFSVVDRLSSADYELTKEIIAHTWDNL